MKQSTKFRFDQASRKLVHWGVHVDLGKTREAYFHTKVLTKKQYRSMLRLLEIFGRRLSILSNQIAMENLTAEPAAVARAKQFIAQNQDGAICLASVAKAVNTSTFCFCKLFKRATGLTFTDYLARVRIEKAKTLLLDRIGASAKSPTMSAFNRSPISIVLQEDCPPFTKQLSPISFQIHQESLLISKITSAGDQALPRQSLSILPSRSIDAVARPCEIVPVASREI